MLGFSFSFAKQSGGFGSAGQQDSNTQQKSSFGGFGAASQGSNSQQKSSFGGFGSTGFGQQQQSSTFPSPFAQKSSFGSPSQTNSSAFGGGSGFSS